MKKLDKRHCRDGDEHPQIRQARMEKGGPRTVEEPGDVAIRHHIQALLPKHLRNPYQTIWPQMGRQGNRLHHPGDNHSEISKIQNEVQKGVLRGIKRVQGLLKRIHEGKNQEYLTGLSLEATSGIRSNLVSRKHEYRVLSEFLVPVIVEGDKVTVGFGGA